MNNEVIGKLLLSAGLVLAVAGGLFLLLSRFGVGRLPGDVHFEGERFSLAIPIMTCIVISIVLTVAVNLFFRR